MIGSGMICQAIPYREGFGAKQIAWLVHSAVVGSVVAPLTLLGGPLMIRAACYTAGVVGGIVIIAFSSLSSFLLVWVLKLRNKNSILQQSVCWCHLWPLQCHVMDLKVRRIAIKLQYRTKNEIRLWPTKFVEARAYTQQAHKRLVNVFMTFTIAFIIGSECPFIERLVLVKTFSQPLLNVT